MTTTTTKNQNTATFKIHFLQWNNFIHTLSPPRQPKFQGWLAVAQEHFFKKIFDFLFWTKLFFFLSTTSIQLPSFPSFHANCSNLQGCVDVRIDAWTNATDRPCHWYTTSLVSGPLGHATLHYSHDFVDTSYLIILLAHSNT